MYYVYVLLSQKDHKFYTGCTNNLKIRLKLHNEGKVNSTKNRTPFKLIHYECFIDTHDAFVREQWLKTGWGRNQLKTMLQNYLRKQLIKI